MNTQALPWIEETQGSFEWVKVCLLSLGPGRTSGTYGFITKAPFLSPCHNFCRAA